MIWLILITLLPGAGFVKIVSWPILDAIMVPWFTYGLILITLCSFYIPAILWKPERGKGDG